MIFHLIILSDLQMQMKKVMMMAYMEPKISMKQKLRESVGMLIRERIPQYIRIKHTYILMILLILI
jgi:hypothetical protein